MTATETLRKTELFSDLREPLLVGLSEKAVERRLARGEILFVMGEKAKGLYVIAAGSLRAYRTGNDGREQTIQQAWQSLDPGGEAVVVGLMRHGATVTLDAGPFVDEKRIRGCYLGSSVLSRDVPALVDLYLAGELMLDDIISHRIGLSGHHARNQAVCLKQAPVRVIYEPALNLMPGFQKMAAFCRRESADVKALYPLCAVLKRGFGSPTISCFGHCARVLRTKALSQAYRAITLDEIRNINTNDQTHDKDNRHCYCIHLTCLLSSRSSSAEKMRQE